MRYYPFLVLSLAVAVAGCHDPKAANKENFAKALTAYLNKECVILSAGDPFDGEGFPQRVSENTSWDQAAGGDPQLDALTQAGLVARTDVVPAPTYLSPRAQNVTYDLTNKGRALYKPPGALYKSPNPVLPDSPAGFCAGHIRVVSVDQFTNPVVQGGERVSLVTFTARADIDDWAKQPAIAKAFHDQLHQGQHSRQLPVVQTSDGWAVETGLAGLLAASQH